jgi:pimeloyl-ACP methyl ester carboxylesterase
MKTLIVALTLLGSFVVPSTAFQTKVTGAGLPMILIPGLSSAGETWDSTVDHFKNRFECHVLTVAGFAGVPRVAGPMLDRIVDDLAAYIRERRLAKPVIVGHSLGGFLALKFAIKYPDLAGPIVDVDGYTNYFALWGTQVTAEQAKAMAGFIGQSVAGPTQEAYEKQVKEGAATRPMVSREPDFQTLVKWGLASDRTAVGDAMGEMMATDLRPDLARVKSPTLVLAAWQSYGQYTTSERHKAALHDQFANLPGVRIELNDTARHFIMWDDPRWMLDHMDRFLGSR